MTKSRIFAVDIDGGQDLLKQRPLVVLLMSVSNCTPCETAREALESLACDSRLADWDLAYCRVDRMNKRDVGRLLCMGLRSFPTIRVYRQGVAVHSFCEAPREWGAAQIGEFLATRLVAVGANAPSTAPETVRSRSEALT